MDARGRREPLVLVVGHPRSGTTLLAEQLARIGVSIGEETHCLSNPRLRAWASAERRAGLADFLASHKRMRPYLDCIEHIDDARIRAPEDLLWELATAYRMRTGARMAGEKTPDHWQAVRRLLKRSPGPVKVIWCIRDVRDVIDSMRRVPWSVVGPLVTAHRWKRQARLALRLVERHPDRVRLHIHEDFLVAPDATLAGYAAWLGLPPGHVTSAGGAGSDDGSSATGQSFQTWESDWKAEATRPPDASKRFAWTRVKSSGILFWDVACVTWRVLERLGYPLPPVRARRRDRFVAVTMATAAHLVQKSIARIHDRWESRAR
jgi:hypothetical protein